MFLTPRPSSQLLPCSRGTNTRLFFFLPQYLLSTFSSFPFYIFFSLSFPSPTSMFSSLLPFTISNSFLSFPPYSPLYFLLSFPLPNSLLFSSTSLHLIHHFSLTCPSPHHFSLSFLHLDSQFSPQFPSPYPFLSPVFYLVRHIKVFLRLAPRHTTFPCVWCGCR